MCPRSLAYRSWRLIVLRRKIFPTQHLLDMVIGVHVLHESRDGLGNLLGDVSSIVLIFGAVLRPRVDVCLTWTKASEMDTKCSSRPLIALQTTNLGLPPSFYVGGRGAHAKSTR